MTTPRPGTRARLKLSLLTLCACLAVGASPTPTHAEMSGLAQPWRWSGAPVDVHIELVRGEVIVLRSNRAQLEIEAEVVSQGGGAVRLETRRAGARLEIWDVYPPRAAWRSRRECLPPVGEHGDFWTSRARVVMTVRAPHGVVVQAHVMERS